jgi:hypothetical protein
VGLSIKVLWIAESPPSSGSYFYFPETSSRSYLFSETMRALGWWPIDQTMAAGLDKRELLSKFQGAGYYLVDLVHYPIDKFADKERKAAIREWVADLARELNVLDPHNIIIVKAPLFRAIIPAIRQSVYYDRILHSEPIPFPNNHHQPRYREMVAECISRCI